ncbi:MAG: hypothetical protein V1779_08995 [bacterium]
MKKHIIILLAVILSITYNSFADVRDSAAKYEGTKYIGDIFKEYDYVPEPINKRHSVFLSNSFYLVQLESQAFYEMGFHYLYNIPVWNLINKPLRNLLGPYLKITIEQYPSYTIGLSMKIRYDSPFYLGFNEGIFITKYEDSYNFKPLAQDDEKVFQYGLGLEVELFFGYEIDFNDWLISPELKFNGQLYLEDPGSNHPNYNGFYKSPIQLGLNIGRDF